jgi:preprotein translocase subunit SecA
MQSVHKILTKIFGSRNDRLLKRYRSIVAQVNQWEAKVRPQTDEQLRNRTQEIRTQVRLGKIKIGDVVPEALAIIRESMDRHIGIREIFNPEQNFNPDDYKREDFSDEAYEAYDAVQQRLIQTGESWQTVTIPPVVYDGVRKLFPDSRPPFRARPFDVQLIGGLVLYEGKIAEMATGEGKTFVGPLACFLKVLEGNHCHVVTVNDYLVRRDATWTKPAFDNLGLSVGFIQADMDPGGDGRRRMYECDITYGTNSEFGFDFLRDNMKESADLQVQGPLDFAIVDEVDSILIDEARTPLIISGAAHDDAPKYSAADVVARKVIDLHKPYAEAERKVDGVKRKIKATEGDIDKSSDKAEKERLRKLLPDLEKQLEEAEAEKATKTQYYEVELDRKTVHLTHEGIAAAQEAAGVGSFYVGQNMEWPHLMEQSLRAHVVYERDKDYVVERGTGPRATGELEVVIVDEYTGRKMVGRQWSDGLHQAIEAKERVRIKQETQTLATITLQNFFKLYKSISGMTGTAMTESEEFTKIYRLEVVTIPTNRPRIRIDSEDRVYRTEPEKWEAILEEIKTYSDAGRPVLVGTTSVEKSEMLSRLLTRKYGIQHEVLNAKQHEREAHIVEHAGQSHINAHGNRVGNVTIATNMAGRGTDIKLAPETQWDVTPHAPSDKKGAWKWTLKQRGTGEVKEIVDDPESMLPLVYQLGTNTKASGGLHVIGTERHTARRIDNQLRGRSGRQGDPGSSRFYVSLQDDLMKMFAGEWTIRVLSFLGMKEGEAIEDRRITKGIERAQKKVEERNFLARKNLLDYDEVMDKQRSSFYGMRQQVLEGRDVDRLIWKMIGESIDDAVEKYITNDYVAASIAEWSRVEFDVQLEPEDLKGFRKFKDIEDLIKNTAKNDIATNLAELLREFLGEDLDDNNQWDAKGLSSWMQSKYGVQISPQQIKRMSAKEIEDTLKDAATAKIDARDCAGIMKYLEPDYAVNELAQWAKDKFNVEVDPKGFVVDAERHIYKPADQIVETIETKAREQYRAREVQFPVDNAMAMFLGQEQPSMDNAYGVDALRDWIKWKYDADFTLEELRGLGVEAVREKLYQLQEQFLFGRKIEAVVDAILKQGGNDLEKTAQLWRDRFRERVTARDLDPLQASTFKGAKEIDRDGSGGVTTRDILLRRATTLIRRELNQLEQYLLITIFDQSWKDHLYAMDLLRNGIGLQAFAEKDPRVQYKKEGFRYFGEMMRGVRDKVTDLIFRVSIGGPVQARSAYRVTSVQHEAPSGYGVGENVRETATLVGDGGPQPQQAQAGDGQEQAPVAVKQIVRDTPKVGRNDPCPCGSGKKYKKCHGADAVA